MGNDGGSIPKRRELVKSAARLPTVSELKATALEALTHAWQTDPISSDPLDLDNVASDWRGRLYNYETVVRGLMPDATDDVSEKQREAADGDAPADGELTFAATGIRSLRDVVRLHCDRVSSQPTGVWQCPVSLKELGPSTKAVYLVPCGHVFAEVAVDKILPDKVCPQCSVACTRDNVVPILPTDASELDKLRQRIATLRAEGLTHSLKKDKSQHHGDKKKKKRKAEAEGEITEGKGGKKAENGAKRKKEKVDHGIASRINNPMTASLTAKVLAEQELLQRRRKLAESR